VNARQGHEHERTTPLRFRGGPGRGSPWRPLRHLAQRIRVIGALATLAALGLAPGAVAQPPTPSLPANGGGAAAVLLPDFGAPFLAVESWPARWSPDGSSPGVLLEQEVPTGRLGVRRVFLRAGLDVNLAGDDPAAIDARSLVSRWPDAPTVRVRTEGAGAAIVQEVTGRRRGDPRPSAVYRYVTGQEGGKGVVEIQRTWFALYEPGGEVKGLALLMPGLLGTPEGLLDAMTAALASRGWLVVRMMCQPSRFTQSTAILIADDEPTERLGPRAAGLLTDGVAESAFAVRAVCAELEKDRPALVDRPRVAIGMSGGALILPGVVAAEPDRYAAAVLIGGGADLFTILDRSNYTAMIDGGRIAWATPPTLQRRRDVADAYLAHAPLDPFHAASCLKRKKVLVYHGSLDQAVPAATGDLLWERIGRPERRSYPLGHELLFLGMATELPGVMDWLDAAVARTP